jgi:hypothetical protein
MLISTKNTGAKKSLEKIKVLVSQRSGRPWIRRVIFGTHIPAAIGKKQETLEN